MAYNPNLGGDAGDDGYVRANPANPNVSGPTSPTDPGTVDSLRSLFPWLDQIGLSPQFFHDLVATAAGPAEIYAKLKQTPQYKQAFMGITRSDGTARMTEADYLKTIASYKQVATQYGVGAQYTTKQSLIGLIEGEIDPNEFKDRLDVWKKVRDEGGAIKDAFYVYAGLDIKDDDLFEAMVDPAAGAKLAADYNAATATQSLDYETWITRATTLGLSKVATKLGELKGAGALTGQAVQSVLATDPAFARQMMDVLYTGGSNEAGMAQTMGLQDLLATFEYAALGAAAKGAGLTMPDRARVQQLRAAGITRARASEAYTQFGTRQGILSGAYQRIGEGTFGQDEFERAVLLGDSALTERLGRATAAEDAAGHDQGGAQFSQDPTGRFRQTGLRSL